MSVSADPVDDSATTRLTGAVVPARISPKSRLPGNAARPPLWPMQVSGTVATWLPIAFGAWIVRVAEAGPTAVGAHEIRTVAGAPTSMVVGAGSSVNAPPSASYVTPVSWMLPAFWSWTLCWTDAPSCTVPKSSGFGVPEATANVAPWPVPVSSTTFVPAGSSDGIESIAPSLAPIACAVYVTVAATCWPLVRTQPEEHGEPSVQRALPASTIGEIVSAMPPVLARSSGTASGEPTGAITATASGDTASCGPVEPVMPAQVTFRNTGLPLIASSELIISMPL